MRRLFSVAIALFMLVLLSSAVFGQRIAPISYHSEAETYCWVVKDSTGRVVDTTVVSVMDMAQLAKPGSVEELKVHEGQHAKEMMRNHHLCQPTWTELLGMETRAYCAALRFLVARSPADSIPVEPQKVYIEYLGLIQQQFLRDSNQTEVKNFQIISAWFNECGQYFTANGKG